MDANIQEQGEKVTLFTFFKYTCAVGAVSALSIFAISNIYTELSLYMVDLSGKLEVQVASDGSTTFHFGHLDQHSVTCQGSTPIAWTLPANRSADAVAHICTAVGQHQE